MCGAASTTDIVLEKRNGSAGRGASACAGIVVGLRQLPIVGSKSEVVAQVVEVQVHIGIVVGLRQLPVVGSKSEVAAQVVEVQVHMGRA